MEKLTWRFQNKAFPAGEAVWGRVPTTSEELTEKEQRKEKVHDGNATQKPARFRLGVPKHAGSEELGTTMTILPAQT